MVKVAMEKGEMDAEPELTMDSRKEGDLDTMEWDGSENQTKSSKDKKRKDGKSSKSKGIQDDAFFQGSDEGESEEG